MTKAWGALRPEPPSGLPAVRRSESQAVGFPSGFARPLVDLPTRDVGRSKSGTLVDYLRTTRNDLEAPARAIQPVIGEVIAVLENSGALFARMSGSGATCFGIFKDKAAAEDGKALIGINHPDWWIA